MALHYWVTLWAVAALISWPATTTPGEFGYLFPTLLWLFGVVASLATRRVSLALVAAPLLDLAMLIGHAPPERAWPLAVLLGLQLVGGSSLGSLLLCGLTYAGLAGDGSWMALGSAVLLGNALLLGYLRNRGRLEWLLARAQDLSWLGIKAIAIAIVAVAVIGGVVGSGGTGIFALVFFRGVWNASKSEQEK